MMGFIKEHSVPCPTCGKHDFTDIRQFNLMFKSFMGKKPFGIGQVGKSFRNEITPGNFIFRTREFEQMELEFFCEPGTDLEWFQYWRGFCRDWLLSLGMKEEELRLRDHDPAELAFYSKGTTDIEFLFPFGWGELWGIADRTDYDLTQHQNTSGQDLTYLMMIKGERYIPSRYRAFSWRRPCAFSIPFAAGDATANIEQKKCRIYAYGTSLPIRHLHQFKIGVLPPSKKLK